ncbi:MAG: MarR family transcriptional regulator [Tepidiformaceae bacterium]
MTEEAAHSPLSGEDLQTWVSLATLLEWLPLELDAELSNTAQITHFEFGIVYALEHAPDLTLRMSVLASYANSSLSRLSRAIQRLEKRQWVFRVADPLDGRYTLATLTELGRDAYRLSAPGHDQTIRRLVLDPLTQAQRKQLRAINERILGAIRKEQGWQPPAG